MNIILTIISAIFAFCCAVLIGSRRQKEKDDKVLNQYKKETEAAVRSVNQKAAEAQAEKKKADTEKEIMKETVEIISEPVVEQRNEELQEMAEKAETDKDTLDVLNAMKADSERRAEELRRRYEQ